MTPETKAAEGISPPRPLSPTERVDVYKTLWHAAVQVAIDKPGVKDWWDVMDARITALEAHSAPATPAPDPAAAGLRGFNAGLLAASDALEEALTRRTLSVDVLKDLVASWREEAAK